MKSNSNNKIISSADDKTSNKSYKDGKKQNVNKEEKEFDDKNKKEKTEKLNNSNNKYEEKNNNTNNNSNHVQVDYKSTSNNNSYLDSRYINNNYDNTIQEINKKKNLDLSDFDIIIQGSVDSNKIQEVKSINYETNKKIFSNNNKKSNVVISNSFKNYTYNINDLEDIDSQKDTEEYIPQDLDYGKN